MGLGREGFKRRCEQWRPQESFFSVRFGESILRFFPQGLSLWKSDNMKNKSLRPRASNDNIHPSVFSTARTSGGHVLERDGASPSSLSAGSERTSPLPSLPAEVALPTLSNPVWYVIRNLHFQSSSCLWVYHQSSEGWMMTSNLSWSLLLPNHSGPFPNNKTMSLHICLDTTWSWKQLSTEKKSPPLQSEIAQAVPD